MHPISGFDKEDNEYTSIIKVIELLIEAALMALCLVLPLANMDLAN